jgi:diguanylate cyclase (GGDEF)-like protein
MPVLDTTTTWIAVGLAVGAAGLALVAIVAAIVLARGRQTSPRSAALVPAGSGPQLEQRLAELERALADAREESHRTRLLGGVRASLDLDAVVQKTLEVASAIDGVDAAMVLLPGTEGEGQASPYVATVGMSSDEAAEQPLAPPAEGKTTRTVALSYRYDGEANGTNLIRGGVAVPLKSEGADAMGTLAVFWRRSTDEATDAQVAAVEELAVAAGPAIDNARRFREARQLADLDALTTLHNRRYFHETLARETARAHRYSRRLSLIVFDVDDFKAINDRVGHLAGDALLAEIGQRVQSVVRSADVACRVGGDEFAVILPESTIADAEQLYARLHHAVASRPAGAADRLRLSAGMAELQPEDDSVSFFERADEALYRAKETGKGRAVAAAARTRAAREG